MKKQSTSTKIISENAIRSYIKKNHLLTSNFHDKNHQKPTDFEEYDALVNKAPLALVFSGSHLHLSDFSQSHLYWTAFKSFVAHFDKFSNVNVGRFLEACDFRRNSKLMEEENAPADFNLFMLNLAYWIFHDEHDGDCAIYSDLAAKAEERMTSMYAEAEQELLSTMIAPLPATQSIHTIHKI